MGDASDPGVYFDPKKSTENFARLCQLLVTICTEVMRDILCHYIKPSHLRSELDKKRSKLGKLNAQEQKLLYPPLLASNVKQIRSKDLDLSLLYKILRNMCNIPAHTAGWGIQPVPGDFSMAACIERIRILRNSISGHSTNGTIGDQDFKNYWKELRESVIEIEKEVIGSDRYEKWIDHLHDCDLNPSKSKEYMAQICKNTHQIHIKEERIDLVEGELNLKRERIDLVEEDANAKKARLKILEEKQASLDVKFEEGLAAIKLDIMKELRATEMRLHKSIGIKNSDSKADTSTYITMKSTTRTSNTTTIKFKSAVFQDTNVFEISMHSTTENRCWLMVPRKQFAHSMSSQLDLSVSSKLYLLNEVDVMDEFSIPREYDKNLFQANITSNQEGEVVFVSGSSVVAAKGNGTFRKLFDLPKFYHGPFTSNLFCTSTGNYIIKIGIPHIDSFVEYSRDGVPLRHLNKQEKFCRFMNVLFRNTNNDIVLTHRDSPFSNQHLAIFDQSFNLKRKMNIENEGIITTVMNEESKLLYGHGQSIDLLDDKGTFVRTAFKAHGHDKIKNIAYSKNSTAWVLYDSFEIDIFKLQIP